MSKFTAGKTYAAEFVGYHPQPVSGGPPGFTHQAVLHFSVTDDEGKPEQVNLPVHIGGRLEAIVETLGGNTGDNPTSLLSRKCALRMSAQGSPEVLPAAR